jgi:hypothetical protein
MGPQPMQLRFAIAFLALTAIGTTLYWIVFFTSGAVHVRNDATYIAFEQAFPLADAWMATCALLGAIGLWRRRSWGLLCGLLDVLFNLNEGNYAMASVAMNLEISINVALLAGGMLLIVFLWSHRQVLQHDDD